MASRLLGVHSITSWGMIQILFRKFHSGSNRSTRFVPRYGLVDWVHYELGFNIKQDWLNLLKNEKQLFFTTRNVNSVSRIRSTMKRNVKTKETCWLPEFLHEERQRAVHVIETWLEEFNTKTFWSMKTLFCIHFSQQLLHQMNLSLIKRR